MNLFEERKKTPQARITELREQLPMNKTQFGKLVGYTRTYISYLESGSKPITEETAKIIATAVTDYLNEQKGNSFSHYIRWQWIYSQDDVFKTAYDYEMQTAKNKIGDLSIQNEIEHQDLTIAILSLFSDALSKNNLDAEVTEGCGFNINPMAESPIVRDKEEELPVTSHNYASISPERMSQLMTDLKRYAEFIIMDEIRNRS